MTSRNGQYSGRFDISDILTSIFLVGLEKLGDLLADFTIWNLDIVLHVTSFGHQTQETVVGDIKLHRVSLEKSCCSGNSCVQVGIQFS